MNEPETIRTILKNAKTIAVVGLSDKPGRPSLSVAHYLQQHGYRIVPVNPKAKSKTILGEPVFDSLDEACAAVGDDRRGGCLSRPGVCAGDCERCDPIEDPLLVVAGGRLPRRGGGLGGGGRDSGGDGPLHAEGACGLVAGWGFAIQADAPVARLWGSLPSVAHVLGWRRPGLHRVRRGFAPAGLWATSLSQALRRIGRPPVRRGASLSRNRSRNRTAGSESYNRANLFL